MSARGRRCARCRQRLPWRSFPLEALERPEPGGARRVRDRSGSGCREERTAFVGRIVASLRAKLAEPSLFPGLVERRLERGLVAYSAELAALVDGRAVAMVGAEDATDRREG